MLKIKDLQHIKRQNGIYALCKDKEIVYIGVSKNVYCRVLEHIIDDSKDFNNVIGLYNDNILNTEITEVVIISRLKPKYNKLVIDEDLFFKTLPKSILGDDLIIFKDTASNIIKKIEAKTNEV